MTDSYIPKRGDKVSWPHTRVGMGTVKGEVDYVESITNETAIVFVSPSKYQAGMSKKGAQRTKIRKTFSQLTLLERPET